MQTQEIHKIFEVYDLMRGMEVEAPCIRANAILKISASSLMCKSMNGKPVLLIPSMINKAHILDIADDALFAVLSNSHAAYLLDWGELDDKTKHYGFAEYIDNILHPMVQKIIDIHGQPPVLMGYCMGGLIAIIYAQLGLANISEVVNLATPIDFCKAGIPFISDEMLMSDKIDKEFIRNLFVMSNFYNIYKKYLNCNTQDLTGFLKIENWANDGVDLSKAIFVEMRDNFIQNNCIYNKTEFVSKDMVIDMSELKFSLTSIVAKYDKIVPYESSMAAMKFGKIYECDTGHIGLVIKPEMWLRKVVGP